MTDFEYEVMQKKRVARGAAHRKCGAKSKKCSLPSDNLTPAQKRALNGPVTVVKLGQPMAWDAYKELNDSLKKEYLEDLIGSYQASGRELAQMFEVSAATMSRELRRIGLKGHKGAGPAGAAIHKAKWAAFCNGVVGGGENAQSGQVAGEAEGTVQDELLQEEAVTQEEPSSQSGPIEEVCAPCAKRLTVSYNGTPSAEEILKLFHAFVQPIKEVSVTIEMVG